MRKSRPALFRGRYFQEEIVVLCVRWYLRYPLSYRDLEEMMAARGLTVDHSTIAAGFCTTRPFWRSESGARCGSQIDPGALMRPTSEWQDAGRICIEPWIQPATRSTFYFPVRDRIAAKGFLQLALCGRIPPRIITVDGHPAYPSVINELRRTGHLGQRCRYRCSPYLNNRIEQDHRFVKKRVVASQWFRSVEGALRTIGIRSNEHDSQRTDPVACQAQHRWACTFHRANVRPRCLTLYVVPVRYALPHSCLRQYPFLH